MAWLWLAGCSYQGDLSEVACDEDGLCPDGAVCDDGYCIFDDSPGFDAELPDTQPPLDADVSPDPDADVGPEPDADVGPDLDADVGPDPDADVGPDADVLECPSGEEICDEECVNTDEETAHCGECGDDCADEIPDNAMPICDDGECDFDCLPDYELCDGDCVNTQTNTAHCGECDDSCEPNEVCSSGDCDVDCPAELTECDGGCHDIEDTDEHCGGCDNHCDDLTPEHATSPWCSAQECHFDSCDSPYEKCDEDCIDYSTNTDHCGGCGDQCQAGEDGLPDEATSLQCSGGQCEFHDCDDGFDKCVDQCVADDSTYDACNGQCLDTSDTVEHCGECGYDCTVENDDIPEGALHICDGGNCDYTCPPEHSLCGGECVPDDGNYEQCNGGCVDIDDDPDNCGGCGNVCLGDCDDGSCDGMICNPEFSPFGNSESSAAIDNTHTICAAAHLDAVRDHLDGNFIVLDDLDLDDLEDQFEPLGNFSGSIDGNDHEIHNLEIQSTDNRVGLISTLHGTVENLRLVDVDVHGDRAVGGVAGANEGTIMRVEVTGQIAAITDRGGGIAGRSSSGTIIDSASRATVSAPTSAGGLVGRVESDSTISRSFATGNISGTNEIGGLVGTLREDALIVDCYATADATGASEVGGLVGNNRHGCLGSCDGGDIEKSYAFGEASGASHIGGLVGRHAGSVSGSFWNDEVNEDDAGGTGSTAMEIDDFAVQGLFEAAGWNFDDIWMMGGEDRPVLQAWPE